MNNGKLSGYINNPDFIEFYCYKEDKWQQYADWEEKLIAVFGSVEKAIDEFETYISQ